MNRNHLIGFAVAVAALGLLAFVAWSVFEIYPVTESVPPSREARINEYLALDRWLESIGIQVRTESSGDLHLISGAAERQIFIQASLFRWTEEAVEYLVRWVEEGGSLFLALDNYTSWEYWHDEEYFPLLEKFGIEAGNENALPNYHYDPEAPGYDRGVSFELAGGEPVGMAVVADDGGVLALKGWDGLIRLVQVQRGKGKLIVTGRPRFLLSSYLNNAPNARLAWVLFAKKIGPDPSVLAAADEAWLFIRGTEKVRGLLGNLFRQGNLSVLLLSVLFLLVIAFWAVIPVFGLVREDEERPGKPLRERFLAEGRFLKRYGALEFYRDTYVREIRRRLGRQEGLSADDEMEKRILDTWGKQAEERDRRLFVRILRKEPFRFKEFPKMVLVLKSILERI